MILVPRYRKVEPCSIAELRAIERALGQRDPFKREAMLFAFQQGGLGRIKKPGSSGASDPYWSDVLVLVTGDSVNDKSSFARGTPTTTACSSTGSVIRFLAAADGGSNSSGLAFPDAAEFDIGTADFTYECRCRVTRVPSAQTSLGGIWAAGGGSNAEWLVYYTGTTIQTYVSTSVTLVNSFSQSLSSAQTSLSWVRQGSTNYFYVNGVLADTDTNSYSIGPSNLGFSIGNFGADLGLTADYEYVRWTRGIARYPNGTTYTPPTMAEIAATVP